MQKNVEKILLGIDPGSRITGYGLIGWQHPQARYIACGVIRTQGELVDRLGQIYAGLEEVIARYRPDQVAIEDVFLAKNPDSAIKLGQARGAALVCVARHGLALTAYGAREVKYHVVGQGSADKKQVQQMVTRLLKLEQVPRVDAADALAIALCDAYHQQGSLLLARESKQTRPLNSPNTQPMPKKPQAGSARQAWATWYQQKET
ncbi:crossover junction endodeoxyribonuclease RuvC [Allopseudospirillum japonicum]|uniref:Crossover junction endodeoxyribonuclease RuvC n=1 Tax=Allopseudospirillum japonicum TaxID=64971 RepID=A0A1H6T331_9GAMM|nr:crossover junction endodeoxyribonuclease RuvC [Allopseudospirillum japonicum]